MPQVNLDDVIIAFSPASETVHIGVPKDDEPVWKVQKNVTSAFIGTLLTWAPPGSKPRQVFDSEGTMYQIEVTCLGKPTYDTDGNIISYRTQPENLQ